MVHRDSSAQSVGSNNAMSLLEVKIIKSVLYKLIFNKFMYVFVIPNFNIPYKQKYIINIDTGLLTYELFLSEKFITNM